MTVPVDKGQHQLMVVGGGYFPMRTARCGAGVHFNTPQKLNYLSNSCALQLRCYCNHWFNALHFSSPGVDVCCCTTVNVDDKRESLAGPICQPLETTIKLFSYPPQRPCSLTPGLQRLDNLLFRVTYVLQVFLVYTPCCANLNIYKDGSSQAPSLPFQNGGKVLGPPQVTITLWAPKNIPSFKTIIGPNFHSSKPLNFIS